MDKMREAFEETAKDWMISLAVNPYSGEYYDNEPNYAWRAFEAGAEWQAAQSASVPVAGEVVAYEVSYENARHRSLHFGKSDLTRLDGAIQCALIVQPATSISAAELEDLRKDAERLQYMIDEAAIIMCAVGTRKTVYRLEWPLTGYVQTDFYPTEREAIDAAIAEEKK